MTERPDRPLDEEDGDEGPDRTISEATPWGSDAASRVDDLGEESIGGGEEDAPDSDIEAATSVGDERTPKDTDAVPNV